MGLPVILVDSGSGSDTQASGAGPGTALFGTTDASTDGAGTTVTVTAGTDLSGVATDGSHAIFLNDTTAGARNFGKITGKAGSGGATPNVTVSDAFGLSLSTKSWAIGGRRSGINTTLSRKLIENNSSSGDAMPGWVIELQSAHSETITANLRFRRSGDTTDGPITLRGVSGAATLPLLTANFNGQLFTLGAGDSHHFMDFEIRNSNGTKTSAIGWGGGSGGSRALIKRIKCNHANNFGRFASNTNAIAGWTIEDCDIGGCTLGEAILITGSYATVKQCHIHDCTTNGISVTGSGARIHAWGNLIYNCGGDGINISSSSTGLPHIILQNTIYNMGADGIELAMTGSGLSAFIENNEISDVVYGINLSGASVDEFDARNHLVLMRNNNIFDCSTGPFNPANLINWAEGTLQLDPQFLNAAGLDFGIGTNLKAQGFSTSVLRGSATRSYLDIGAAQRVEPVGGGSSGGHIIGA